MAESNSSDDQEQQDTLRNCFLTEGRQDYITGVNHFFKEDYPVACHFLLSACLKLGKTFRNMDEAGTGLAYADYFLAKSLTALGHTVETSEPLRQSVHMCRLHFPYFINKCREILSKDEDPLLEANSRDEMEILLQDLEIKLADIMSLAQGGQQ